MDFTKQQEVYAQVVQKAWEDADFKAKLVADPIATLEAFTGEKFNVPEGKTLVVRDQTDESTMYINIPPAQTRDEVELTDEQLEAVAGGAHREPVIDIEKLFGPLIYNPIENISGTN
jgi:hypothetical protein